MFDINSDIFGYSIIQIYWATQSYTIFWMNIGKTITYILHMQHAHHFLAYFPYTSASKLIIFLRSVLTDLSIPPSGPTPVYDHVSIVINACHLTNILDNLIHRTTNYKTGINQGGFINPMDILTKPLDWVLHSFHAHHILGHYPSPLHNIFRLFTFYFIYFPLTYILSLFFYWRSGGVLLYVWAIHTTHRYMQYHYPVRYQYSHFILVSSTLYLLYSHWYSRSTLDTTIQTWRNPPELHRQHNNVK